MSVTRRVPPLFLSPFMSRGTNVLSAARALEPLIRGMEDQIDAQQTLPKVIVDSLIEAGVFKTHAPRAIGGLELDAPTYFEVVEELSRINGSVGWLAMINCGNFYSWFPEPIARDLFRA